MEDRTGIFAGDDPFRLTEAWMKEAWASEISDAHAATLSTVDADGMPNGRIVLVKEIEASGFVFYTNYESTKGQELVSAGKAALLFHWKSLGRQIRVRGEVEKVDPAQSDAYYNSRPLDSRLGAWASDQSRPLANRGQLEDRLAQARTRFGEAPTRPPHWGGFRIRPISVEFWSNGAFRLHDRFIWTRDGLDASWKIERLFP